MTYTPTAYVTRHDGRFWVFITTPSGAIVRLLSNYTTQGDGEMAATALGFRLIDRPTVTTLHRGNTTPR